MSIIKMVTPGKGGLGPHLYDVLQEEDVERKKLIQCIIMTILYSGCVWNRHQPIEGRAIAQAVSCHSRVMWGLRRTQRHWGRFFVSAKVSLKTPAAQH
jgi:hypothetical protein